MTESQARRHEEWHERIVAFRASGQSKAAWCRAHGLKAHRLRLWEKRFAELAAERPSGEVGPQWMAMTIAQQPEALKAAKNLVLRVGAAEVEVCTGFDAKLLGDVVRVLQATC